MSPFDPKELAWLEQFRQDIHQHPETAFEEERTATLVTQALQDCHPHQILELAGTGRLALFGNQGPTLVFRAELDALPLKEVNPGLKYASRFQGKGHLCGHDGHLTMLLGLARKLHRNPIPGKRIALLFQPAEETGQGGPAIVNEPQLKTLEPKAAFALHNIPGLPLGTVALKEGPFTPASVGISIFLEGKTSHAAEPHLGINPARTVANILLQAGQMVQPNIQSEDFQLLTPVEAIMGSKAFGTSAGQASLRFTLRTLHNHQLPDLIDQFLQMARAEAAKDGLLFHSTQEERFFANQNHPALVSLLRSATMGLGFESMERNQPYPWCEDFGAITAEIPGLMFGLGSGTQQPALHNPNFDFPDALLPFGIHLFYALAQQYSNSA